MPIVPYPTVSSDTLLSTCIKLWPTNRMSRPLRIRMDFIWEFRFAEDGKLKYVREYNDTASIGGTFDV